MNHGLIANFCSVVQPEDELWIVGDLCMGNIEAGLELAVDLPGNKTLIPGNHDKCWPGGKKNWAEWVPRYEEAGFTILQEEYPGAGIPVKIGSHDVMVSHFPPWVDDRHGDRYSAWRPFVEEDQWCTHGHTHQFEQVTHGHSLHVGVDAWDYRPCSDDQLLAIIEGNA